MVAERKPLKLRERAYESFTRHLLARDIRPGQFISQRELVGLIGLPLGAIRELVPRLEAEGLIRTVPQRGMQVAHLDLNLIRDAFQFRVFLEREATAIFAATANDGTIARLRSDHDTIIAACEAARAAGGVTPDLVSKAQAIDWDFHTTVINSLDNAIITNAYRVNLVKIRLIRQEQTRLDSTRAIPTMQEHLAIITAIGSRDPTAAAEAMVAHINNARNRAMGLI
jgi:DNA-binding GntR family transcriptional regulator